MAFGIHTVALVTQTVAFAFLLIAVLTVPVTKSLALSEYSNYRYGVFGYCKISTGNCSKAAASYKPSEIGSGSDWKMNDNARDKLAEILIVTPVAAGLCLISVITLALGHIRRCTTAGAYWGIVVISTVIAFLASALVCIVVFLLFWPHMKWPGWLLIGSGVLSLASIVFAFLAMKLSPDESSNDLTSMDPMEGHRMDLLDKSYDASTFTGTGFKGPATAKSLNSSEEKKSLNDFSNPYQSSGTFYNQSSSSFNHLNKYETTVGVVTGTAVAPASAATLETNPFAQRPTNAGNSGLRFDNRGYDPETRSTNSNPLQQQPRVPLNAGSSTSLVSEQPKALIPQIANPYDTYNDPDLDLAEDVDIVDTTKPTVSPDGQDIIADDESDFTSVSQRAVNPRYYQAPAPQQQPQQHPPFQQTAPQQGYSAQQVPVPVPQQGAFPHSASYYPTNSPVLQGPPAQQRPAYNPYNSGYSSGMSQQNYPMMAPQAAPAPPKPRNTISDSLLNNNPDFSVTGTRGKRKYGILAQAQAGRAPGAAPGGTNYGRRSSGSGYPAYGNQF
ncbi:unnamed protein product [Kuraishia capsulata CBS 1993]|uniref:PH-response regulator protein palI/RIM9 n=1 Tax=Kuraishia capsulata CBS 1993 TaxID=1382522 RepID=W6MHJ3_9ASCO|nr:uncharacterized protein KUCA_T00001145001 [Kuraishia capsulata CBS 1993]CDK25178.1 unnamed protein product [Kuraishia capsulata CBS 1993]